MLAFFGAVILALAIGGSAIYALRTVTLSKNSVVYEYSDELIQVERLRILAERIVASGRGFLITNDPSFLNKMKSIHQEFETVLTALEVREDQVAGRKLLHEVRSADLVHMEKLQSLTVQRSRVKSIPTLEREFESGVQPARESFEQTLNKFGKFKRTELEDAKKWSARDSRRSILVFSIIGGLSMLLILIAFPLIGRALLHAFRNAEMAVQMRDDFVAIVSHDLKNPLGSITMAIDLVLRRFPGEEKVEPLRRAKKSATRMNQLISQILDISKIESGSIVYEFAKCDLRQIVEEVFQDLAAMAEEKQINLHFVGTGETTVNCDHDRLFQAISNLVSNAVKFSPIGETVSVQSERGKGEISIAVSDHGPGIPPNEIENLFNRYWQARKTRKMGTGIGLSIVKAVVDAHGGKIFVTSEVGNGSTFRVLLPVRS